MAAHEQATTLDEMDPHGIVGHHGHVIIPVRVLTGVLLILLFFTVLTVFCSRAEVWATRELGMHIPQLVNVLIALSIAVVKSTLVAMYFMQLKYDNPLNSLIFLFCLFAFTLFLFFCLTDLGTRGVVYNYKSPAHYEGGTGVGNISTFQAAKDREVQRIGEEKFKEDVEHHAHAAEVHDPSKPPSDANRSRPLRGLTSDKGHAPAHGEEAAQPGRPPEGEAAPKGRH